MIILALLIHDGLDVTPNFGWVGIAAQISRQAVSPMTPVICPALCCCAMAEMAVGRPLRALLLKCSSRVQCIGYLDWVTHMV